MSVRDEVSLVLARRDPLGLISIGASADEYDPETRTIAPRMREAMSVEGMRRSSRGARELVLWGDRRS